MVSITFMIIFHSISQFMSEWIINLERVELPNSSPDLNVIENLWYTLKDCVARDAPRTEDALRRSLNRNWRLLLHKIYKLILKVYILNILNVWKKEAKDNLIGTYCYHIQCEKKF